jgi:pullulanase/glycogen debranching enzyme
VNFTLFSAHAERVELCVFDAQGNEQRFDLPARTGDIWHGWLLPPGRVCATATACMGRGSGAGAPL